MNKRAYWLLVPLTLLVFLGGLNIYRKIAWKEPTDGVDWQQRAARLTAVKVDPNGPGYIYAGIKTGDILYSINGVPINNKIDLVKSLWTASRTGQKLSYEINRQGELLFPSLTAGTKGASLNYFYLALIGLLTLIIGLIVFFNSPRPLAPPNSYYYLLAVVLFGFYVYSPTGQLDLLDNVFYWLNNAAFLAFPPLLLHFFLIFPQRKKLIRRKPSTLALLYVPAVLLLAARIAFHLPQLNNLDATLTLRIYETLEKISLFHFALYTFLTLATLTHSYLRHPGYLVRKQLKWIVYGLGIGILPFTALYIIPYLLGRSPGPVAELTILLQALVPLSFSYSISRTRVTDLEVLLKKAATLIFSYFVLALLYLAVGAQTKIFSENRLNAILLWLLAIVLGGTLFTPLKKLFQVLFDRLFYRRSYQYRRTLLSISKEISRERNLENLARSLLELIANALTVDGIALLLPVEGEARTFDVFSARGGVANLPPRLTLDPELYQELKTNNTLSFYALSDQKDLQARFGQIRTSRLEHILGLQVEDSMIGLLAMGRKTDRTFLTSEDWELLATIASPVALAVENAYLYNQASLRARELERLKDYSENIIESRVIGWNRVLEETFGRKKAAVIGDSLLNVLGPDSFSAVFPPDTQADYHLLSEIRILLPSGVQRIFDVAKTPLLDNRLNPYGTIVVFEDTTEKIQMQQQLLTSEKLASIGLLSAGVAHEINTPLTGISSYVQMLQKKSTDAQFGQILQKIEVQTDRVSRIIKNLLAFSRSHPSDQAFHRVALAETVQEILSLIDYKLKTMNIALELALTPVKPLWAQGERLQQVFLNIILNALDAMPGGGTLRIELAETATEALIRIRDTGTGIKEQHLPHIFDPFFTTKGLGKGTGLGLSISYAIVKEHEGRIGVESAVGRGTTFTIGLPKDLDRRKLEAARAANAST
jgi:two-component system NtrC family sensor kinase